MQQHAEPIDGPQAALASAFEEIGFERHVNDVGDDRSGRQTVEREYERRRARHAEARRIDEEAGFRKQGVSFLEAPRIYTRAELPAQRFRPFEIAIDQAD